MTAENQLDRIEGKVDVLAMQFSEHIGSHEKIASDLGDVRKEVFGNGNPGLKMMVNSQQIKCDQHHDKISGFLEDQKEKNGPANRIKERVATALIVAIIIGATSWLMSLYQKSDNVTEIRYVQVNDELSITELAENPNITPRRTP